MLCSSESKDQLINSFCYAWKDLKDDYIDYAYVRLIILKIKKSKILTNKSCISVFVIIC